MATVRTVSRGGRPYYYLVQSYRWQGAIHRKEEYLGTSLPPDVESARARLEVAIWQETWFRQFDLIKAAFAKRQAVIPDTVREKELDDFIVQFTYDTNRIEGSTLSLDDTRLLLERGITPGRKPVRDVQETRAHADLLRRLIRKPESVHLRNLLRWHKELFSETKPDIAGRVRDYEVRITGSRHQPPPSPEVRPLLLELFRWAIRAAPKTHPVQIAAEFHLRFENIHPFGDGNGRVGRLAMNVLLARSGYPMLNVEYARRRGYYNALEQSSVRGNSRPFLHWFFLRYLRENQFYLRR